MNELFTNITTERKEEIKIQIESLINSFFVNNKPFGEALKILSHAITSLPEKEQSFGTFIASLILVGEKPNE